MNNYLSFVRMKELIIVAFPLVMQNSFRMFLGIADKVFVGQLGENSIAGVGAANQLFGLFLTIFFSFSAGLTVLSSQYLGSNKKKEFSMLFSTVILFSILIGVALILIFNMYSKDFLSMMNIKNETLDISNLYFTIIIPTFLFSLLSSNMSSFFISIKRNIFPMMATFISLGINALGDWYFIFVADLGVQGVAYATLIARISEFIFIMFFIIIYFNKKSIPFSFTFDFPKFKKLMKISLPMSIDGAVWQFAMVVHTSLVFLIGVSEVAVFEIMKVFQQLVLTPINAIAAASVGILGTELGKKEFNEARAKSVNSIILSVSLTTLFIFVVIIFKNQIFSLFNIDEKTLKLGLSSLNFIIILIYAQTFNIILPFILRTGGDTWANLLITIIGFWGIQLPLTYLLGLYLSFGLYGIISAMIISESIKGVLFFIRYKKEKWIRDLT
ncbi:MATE family efflux transporter [Geotoga petraea]|uniref:Multidrug-efflux transporter n=1 Tax=Geotoga petraea TaxID=28234 RepID=A0A4Z0VYV4_9BACT|nr:MATE family efflux transporter [Geotoga petraea]TGG89238.1 MATE family efflux transporter [Geotoga petraea]